MSNKLTLYLIKKKIRKYVVLETFKKSSKNVQFQIVKFVKLSMNNEE